jgi:hypothetical protein
MQALRKKIDPSPGKLLVFPSRMSTPPIPEVPEPPVQHTWWQRHGTTAQLVTSVVAIVGLFLNLGVTLWVRSTQTASTVTDEHTNTLIEAKLKPDLKDATLPLSSQIGDLGRKIDSLSDRVSRIEGSLGSRISSLETKADRQASLGRLENPGRTLALIRQEIENAYARERILSESTLVDYRNALQTVPPSTFEYWATVAAVVNYQSKMNQMAGIAPDPMKVSKFCGGLTNGNGINNHNNFYRGEVFRNCIVDLDTDTFQEVEFKDSVVRYSGGEVHLNDVNFVNCRFILKIAERTKPANAPLLLALLKSDDQKEIRIPNPATH